MNESQFGFEYSWDDLKPVRPLFVTILVAQVVGAVGGLVFGRYPTWIENLWAGGAIATFAGYLLGLWVQAVLMPGSIGRNGVMVRRLGLVAAFFAVMGVLMPFGE